MHEASKQASAILSRTLLGRRGSGEKLVVWNTGAVKFQAVLFCLQMERSSEEPQREEIAGKLRWREYSRTE